MHTSVRTTNLRFSFSIGHQLRTKTRKKKETEKEKEIGVVINGSHKLFSKR
jgi:hypothetical protein